jgi:biotin carboxyl carrier protein
VTIDVEAAGLVRTVEVTRGSRGYTVTVDGRDLLVDVLRAGHRWSLLLDHKSYEVALVDLGAGRAVAYVNGYQVPVSTARPRYRLAGARAESGPSAGSWSTAAPMPGKIVKILVKAGDSVAPNQGLIVIEAMKMENELRSSVSGRVAEVRVAEGVLVEAGTVLVVVESVSA